jgi:hypothetical protein
MKCKVGDRFITGYGNTVELVESNKKLKFLVIHLIHQSLLYNVQGDTFSIGHIPSNYEYLGNFAKSNKFKEIYKILNEGEN